ncbi:MAG: YbaN family protein [Candidatus Sericytochromatia bacterium]
MKKVENKVLRIGLIILGTIFLILGIIGLILPVMPGTIFIILATACYIRSSEKLYLWIINNKWFGKYARLYLKEKAMPLKAKIIASVSLWFSISVSFYLVDKTFVRIILLLVGISVTSYFLYLKTATREELELE